MTTHVLLSGSVLTTLEPWSQSLANAGQDFVGADGSFVLFHEEGRMKTVDCMKLLS